LHIQTNLFSHKISAKNPLSLTFAKCIEGCKHFKSYWFWGVVGGLGQNLKSKIWAVEWGMVRHN